MDLLEDEVMGLLYKTHIDRRVNGLFDLFEPYPFSPSRLNNILALSVTFAWLVLIVRTLWVWRAGIFGSPYSPTAAILSLFTIVVTTLLVYKGQARRMPKGPMTFERRKRQYS